MRTTILVLMVLLLGCDTPRFEQKRSARYQIINAGGMNLLLDTDQGRVWKQEAVANRYVWQQQTVLAYNKFGVGSGDAPQDADDWLREVQNAQQVTK